MEVDFADVVVGLDDLAMMVMLDMFGCYTREDVVVVLDQSITGFFLFFDFD